MLWGWKEWVADWDWPGVTCSGQRFCVWECFVVRRRVREVAMVVVGIVLVVIAVVQVRVPVVQPLPQAVPVIWPAQLE